MSFDDPTNSPTPGAHGSGFHPGRGPLAAVAALALALSIAGCGLDLQNPNAPTEEEVLSDVDGLVAVAVGMQGEYASQVEEFIQAPALATDEWGTDSRSLLSYRSLFLGPPENPVDRGFAVVEEPWAAAYDVIESATTLLDGVPDSEMGPGLQAGTLALARTFKAMALGRIAQQYASLPLGVEDGEAFVDRTQALQEAVSLLEAARGDLQGVAEGDLSGFRSRILDPGLDLSNLIDAMLARYNLFLGNHSAAMTAANRVDPTSLSTFTYTSTTRNPVENLTLQLIYVAPLASFAEAAEPGDGRVAYWVDAAADPYGGNPPDSLLLPPARYAAPTASFPVYLPDEMRLIRAEAHARMGQFGEARDEINAVRTQTSSPVDEPVAGLPELDEEDLDTEAELIAQIAYERRYELYNQGLRWEDTRRLGEDVTVTPVIDFLPIPEQECLTNPEAGVACGTGG